MHLRSIDPDSAAKETMIVYVKLLSEGTAVYRPAEAEEINQNTFKLNTVADHESRDEEWEFPPGSFVKCEQRTLSGGVVMVAIANAV